MESMFENSRFNSPINTSADGNCWNVSNVRTMHKMFSGSRKFNQDIGNWNTSNVTDMAFMFYDARKFNQDINNWDVSNVIDMTSMFASIIIRPDDAEEMSFDKPINNWEFNPNVITTNMFNNATKFKMNKNNYIYNYSDALVNAIPLLKWNPTRKKLLQLYALQSALQNTNIGSIDEPQRPAQLPIYEAVASYADYMGGKSLRKRKPRKKRNTTHKRH